jgi:hypothetical protein
MVFYYLIITYKHWLHDIKMIFNKFLFIRLIDMYTNILETTLYKNKSIYTSSFLQFEIQIMVMIANGTC